MLRRPKVIPTCWCVFAGRKFSINIIFLYFNRNTYITQNTLHVSRLRDVKVVAR